MPKGQKRQRSEGFLFKLIPRKASQSLLIDNEPVKIVEQPESYRAIGKVDSSLLHGATTWDIKYLGFIPGVTDWQSPDSRSDFLEMVDDGQRRGSIMWCSAVPKLLCISPLWVNITDHKKKVLYAQFKTIKIGSMSYAEDDGKHVLGIKTPAVDESYGYCCHVIECVDESAVRNICGYLQDTFQMLMSHMQDENSVVEANPSSPNASERKKSRKLSRAEKKQQKLALKAVENSKSGHLPLANRISSESTHSFDFYKTTNVDNLSDISSIDTPRPSVDHTNSNSVDPSKQHTPRPESVIDKQFSFLNHTGSGDQTANADVSKPQKHHRKAGREMSHQQHQKKSVKADVLLKKLEGSLMLRGKENGVIQELNENDDDDDEMVSPLKQHTSQVSEHSGVVKRHEQLDREGQVITAKHSQYSLPANVRKRSSILTDMSYQRSTMPLPGKSPSKTQVQEIQPKENDSVFSESTSNPHANKEHGDNNIDANDEQDRGGHGDNNDVNDDGNVTPPRVTYPPPIIDSSLPDLETEITTPPPFYKPLLDETITEPVDSRSSTVTTSMASTKFNPSAVSGTAPVSKEPPTAPMTPKKVQPSSVTETPPVVKEPPIVEEPSPPPKKQRKPWPVLIEIEDELLDEAYIDYFAEVEKKVSVIEYRQLRRNWLDYQKCTTDIVGFCKKTKILLRGADRTSLREGARVLVDEDDRETYDLVLSGDYVPKPEKLSLLQRDRIAASIKPRVSNARQPPPVMSRAPPPMISLPKADVGNKTEIDAMRTAAVERPSAKKPEFSNLMKQFESKKPKSQPAAATAAKKETSHVTDDEPEDEAEDEEKERKSEEVEKKAKINQLRQQFEKVKKKEPPPTQSISVSAVSALKKRFVDIGPSSAEVPAWKRALKKKEVIEEVDSASDNDSTHKHHNKTKNKKPGKDPKKKLEDSSEDEKSKKHHGKQDKDKKKMKNKKKHKKGGSSSESENDSETDEDEIKKSKKKKHRDKKDSSSSETDDKKRKAKVDKEKKKEKPPVPFADLPVLTFPAKIEEKQPPPPPPAPDSTTETIDALSDLLMGTNSKTEDVESKESNEEKKISATQKSTKLQKSSHTTASNKKHKTTGTSQVGKVPQPQQQQGQVFSFQQPLQQQQQQFMFGTQQMTAVNPFQAPQTNPAFYSGPFGAQPTQPTITTGFGNPTLAGNMIPAFQQGNPNLQFQQQQHQFQQHPQLFTLQQPVQQASSKQPENKQAQQSKTKTTAGAKAKAAKKSKQPTKVNMAEEPSTLDQLALSLSFGNITLDNDINKEPQSAKPVEPVVTLPSHPLPVSTVTEPMEIDLIPEIKNVLEPSANELASIKVVTKQPENDDSKSVNNVSEVPIQMSQDGDSLKHDVPIPPPIPPVDSNGEIPPTTNDVLPPPAPPPPPLNDKEPPVSTDTPAATLPTQDSPGSSEPPLAPPPPPPPPPVPSSDPQTSADAPTPAPPPPLPPPLSSANNRTPSTNNTPATSKDNKLPEDIEDNRNQLLEDIRKGKKLNATKEGSIEIVDGKSVTSTSKQKYKKDKKKHKQEPKGGKKHKKGSVSSSEDDTDDDIPQEEVSKNGQPETKAAGTPQEQWANRHKKTEPVEEQEEDNSHIVELLDMEIDEDLPKWKKKLLQKKKLKEYQPLLSEQQKVKDEEARFMGVPDWKKKLIVKKEVELARVQKVEEERLRVQKEEEAKFNAMPDWKKRLVSQKRADVRF